MTDKGKQKRRELSKKLGVSRRTAANIVKRSQARADQVPMRRDHMVRRYRGKIDGRYLILRYDGPGKGETFAQAVEEARRSAPTLADLLQVAIRRMDRPGHPWVCEWTRRKEGDAWSFRWMPGADDEAARPLDLVETVDPLDVEDESDPDAEPFDDSAVWGDDGEPLYDDDGVHIDDIDPLDVK